VIDRDARWQDVGRFIREQRESARITLRKLSDLAGISNPYLSQIERGLRKPSAEILGILDAREGDGDVVQAILSCERLTEAQKQALLRVYQSFVHENGGTEAEDQKDGAPAA
jgi:transcriptional regulator with XRE-family HTH domain